MRALIATTVIAQILFAGAAVAATLSSPVTFAAWDFDDGDLVADASGAPFVSVEPAMFGGSGGLVIGAGVGGGNAIRLDPPLDFTTRRFADFTVTNTHPTETISLDEFSFEARRPSTFFLSMNYMASGDTEREIDDATEVAPSWGTKSFDLAALTDLGVPALNFDLVAGASMTMRIVHLESAPANSQPMFIDNVVLTGRTVIPEPAAPLLAIVSLTFLLFGRRGRR